MKPHIQRDRACSYRKYGKYYYNLHVVFVKSMLFYKQEVYGYMFVTLGTQFLMNIRKTCPGPVGKGVGGGGGGSPRGEGPRQTGRRK